MTDPTRESVLPAVRQAGVCLHLASLPGPHGIGEIGEHARHFVDAMKAMGLAVWQFLPTGPTAYGDSPYQPLSTFAGNELLIDVADLVRQDLLADSETQALRNLPTHTVDYANLIPAKNTLLQLAAGRFAERASAGWRAAYDDFVNTQDARWLHDYALFRTLKSRHEQVAWPEWPPEFVHRDPQALRKFELDAAAEIASVKILQFLFHHQWQHFREYANEHGIRLFGDMPIYIALDSADAWAHPELLQIDRDGRPSQVAGVPPDYFSEDGQRWGNPLYDWPAHAADGYRWWIDRLSASVALTDIVRIDHFRGFEAYWSIPAESATARYGEWVPGPGDAIFHAMRNALGALPIVAEDLGVITPEVDALRHRHDMPGMVVLQFDAVDPEFRLDSVAENSVCYTGTHDNDTTVGWFNGSPDDRRSDGEIEHVQAAALRMTGGSPETIHTDLVRAAFSTRARLAIAPMQDFLGLGSEARLNTPGTCGDNWRWRVESHQLGAKIRAQVASLVADARRN